MRSSRFPSPGSLPILLLLLALLLPPGAAGGDAPRRDGAPTAACPPRAAAPAAAAADSLPLHFEENRGQARPAARFLARSRGFAVLFTDRGAEFLLPPAGGGAPPGLLRMEFPGARPGASPAAADPLPGRSHYFLGRDPSRWIRGVPHSGSLRTEDLWPGVDLHWRGLPGRTLEYAFRLAPGADAGALALSFPGAASVAVDARGDLRVAAAEGVLRHRRPVAWQEAGGGRRPVEVAFRAGPGGRAGFALGDRDPRLPLWIDPSLDFSSWLGGSDWDRAEAVAPDGSGGFLVTGTTASFNFPVLSALQPTKRGAANFGDAFVCRVAGGGGGLLWSTYLGGTATEESFGVAADAAGDVYVAGRTGSDDYPTYHAYKGTGSGEDAFLTKLTPEGDAMVYSTRLGGNDTDYARALAVTPSGAAVLAGITGSSDFPKVANLQNYRGDWDAFVTRFKVDGSAPDFSTHLGGNLRDEAFGLAATAEGAILVAGSTLSADFPVQSAHQSARSGTKDGFLVRIEGKPAAVVFSTYLGGAGEDEALAVAVAADGDDDGEDERDAWVVGESRSSSGFPLAAPLRGDFEGVSEAFAARFSPAGALLFSTFLGGGGEEEARGVALDAWGGVHVAGTTDSPDFPVQDAPQDARGGMTDAFVTILDPALPGIHASTYVGGAGMDEAHGLAVGADGVVRIAGITSSTNLPSASPLQGSYGGGTWDGFTSAFRPIPFPPRDCSVVLTGLRAVEVTWTDACLGEDSFVVERSREGGPWAAAGTTGAGETVFQESGLDPSTEYAYRVRAASDQGTSRASDPDSVRTPDPPTFAPAAPSGLTAVPEGPRRVLLSWTDNSDNEDFFVVAVSEDGVLFDTLATPRLGTTSWVDLSCDPDRTYHFMVRAVNPIGSSLKSNVAVATMPSTLTLDLGKSRIRDAASPGKDSVKLAGTFGFGEGAEGQEFLPMARPLYLRIGGWERPQVLVVAAADEGWRSRKGVWTWRSPKGAPTKAKLAVDGSTGAFSVSLKRMTLPLAVANPVRVTLVLGTDAVTLEEPWVEGRKAGDFLHE